MKTVGDIVFLPIVNETTRIYIHDRDPFGVVCTTLSDDEYEFLHSRGDCLVDSFIWFGYNELHIYLCN